jgi:hypothetical protein
MMEMIVVLDEHIALTQRRVVLLRTIDGTVLPDILRIGQSLIMSRTELNTDGPEDGTKSTKRVEEALQVRERVLSQETICIVRQKLSKSLVLRIEFKEII